MKTTTEIQAEHVAAAFALAAEKYAEDHRYELFVGPPRAPRPTPVLVRGFRLGQPCSRPLKAWTLGACPEV